MRVAPAFIALVAAVWGIGVWLSGGFEFNLAGVRLSSSDALRPFVTAVVATAAYVLVSGVARVRADVTRFRLTPSTCAAALAVVVGVVGLVNNSWSAGGSDSYSYVSQMDLWRTGNLKVSIPIAEAAPWPNAIATFTPFGYRTVPGESAIAPVTPPGLPLLMAALKSLAGHPAGFIVPPLAGALLVWTTFLIGRRLGSELIGAGSAWLVATSPTFLMMFKSQMSDVPAAACWALSTYWLLGETRRSAVAAGLAASLAISIRPNLAPLALTMALWMLSQDRRLAPRLLPFAIAALPGCTIVAAVNTWLFGSPLSSGYGDLGPLFSLANVPATFRSYGRSLLETQTPLVVAGVIALLLAPRAIWPTAAARAGARLLAAVFLVTWAVYAAYSPFDAWWFLRFLLPAWPAMFVGTAAVVAWGLAGIGIRAPAAAMAGMLALGLYGLAVTTHRGVFPHDEGERRYATIARLVEARTESSAMILASMHAGPVRYYAGRATMRFDLLDPAWLDRSVEWLRERDRHPYALVEDWEMPAFARRFSAGNRLGDLQLAPVLAYRAYGVGGTVYLFDLLRPDGPTIVPPPIRDPRPRCVEPGPEPSFR